MLIEKSKRILSSLNQSATKTKPTMNADFPVLDVIGLLNITPQTDLQNHTTEHPGQISTTVGLLASSSVWQDARIMLFRIGPAILIPVGTVGNVLTIVVLQRLGTETSTMPLFFTALAVSDICLLYVGLLPVWLEFQFGYSLTASHSVVCKLDFWAFYSLALLSAWLLVAMTIQRAASVVWPHKVSSTCTRRQARFSIVAIVITTFLINGSLLYGMDIHPESGICYFTDSFASQFLDVVVWQDLLMSSLLPFCFLLLNNSVLIWTVLQSLRAARARLHSGQTEQAGARQRKFMTMTVTLIAVSTAFIILTSPIGILSLAFIDNKNTVSLNSDLVLFLSTTANLLV